MTGNSAPTQFAKKDKATATTILSVLVTLSVEKTIAGSFIKEPKGLLIAAQNLMMEAPTNALTRTLTQTAKLGLKRDIAQIQDMALIWQRTARPHASARLPTVVKRLASTTRRGWDRG